MMRSILLSLLLVGILQNVKSQEVMEDQHTIHIKNSGIKYSIHLDQAVVLDNIDSIGQLKNNNHLYMVKKDGKYGMYSSYGVQKLPPIYEKISRLFNEYWIVQSNHTFGIFNLHTSQLLPAVYDEIKLSYKVNAEFIVRKDNKYGVLDGSWKVVVPLSYDFITINGGLIELVLNSERSYLMDGKVVDLKIHTNKNFIVAGQYLSDTRTYYLVERQGKYGIISSKGEIIWEPQYDDIVPRRIIDAKATPENIFFVKLKNKWGVIDLQKNNIAPIEFQSVDIANENYLLVGIENLKQFFSLKNRRVVEGAAFERYYYLPKYSRIEKGEMQTLVDNETMELKIPFKYQFIIYIESANLFSVGVNNKYGIIDSSDKAVIPFLYDLPLFISCGNKIVAMKGNQYGMLDTKNTVLIPFSNRTIISYSQGFERAKENSFTMEKLDCDLKIRKE